MRDALAAIVGLTPTGGTPGTNVRLFGAGGNMYSDCTSSAADDDTGYCLSGILFQVRERCTSGAVFLRPLPEHIQALTLARRARPALRGCRTTAAAWSRKWPATSS